MLDQIRRDSAQAGLALRVSGLRAARHALRAQPELLAVRRLPRHRRGRAPAELDRVVRQVRWRDPAIIHGARAGRLGDLERREVGARRCPFEFMLNTLRLKDGFELELFRERTGLPPRPSRPGWPGHGEACS